ncbi:MAG: hypothetical protein OXH79_14030 [Boseongicola sp.]|nr:hypothetical protein [Boseongicola sp.]
MLRKLLVKRHGILLELSLWILLAIGAVGGIGTGAALGRWSVRAPAGGVSGAFYGIAVPFIGAAFVVAPVIFVRDIRESVSGPEEAGSGDCAA